MENHELKLLFAGPMGAGKTTAINTISDKPCVSTDAANFGLANFSKSTATAALDYGHIALGNGSGARLYGTPGQERFNFMWPTLARNAAGVIVLLNGDDPHFMDDLDTYTNAFWQDGRLPMIIGIGRLEKARETKTLNAVSHRLEKSNYTPPVISIDVRQRDQVLSTIDTLLCLIEINETGLTNT